MIKEVLTLLIVLASFFINQASQEYGLHTHSVSSPGKLPVVLNSHAIIPIASADIVPAQRGTIIEFGEVEVGQSARSGIDFVCNADYCWVAAVIIYPQLPFYWMGCWPSVGTTVPRGRWIRCDIEFRPEYEGTFTSVARVQYCGEEEGDRDRPPLDAPPHPLLTCLTADIAMRGRGILPPNRRPVAACSFSPSSPTTNTVVHFSSAGSYDPDGRIEGHTWDFGDGASSTLPNPTHRYEREGTYSARLTVRDNRGAYSDPATCIVVVSRSSPPLSPVKLAATGGSGVLAGALTYNMLSQPPAPPPMASGFAPALLPATIAVIAGLYLFPVDQLILKFPQGVTQRQAQRLISQVIPASDIIGFFSPINAYLVRFRSIDQITQMEDKIKELERIEAELKRRLPPGSSVLKNYLGRLEGQPDIDRLEGDLRLAYDTVFAKPAWDQLSQTKLHPVRVVIIDSGLSGTHPEFQDVPRWGSSYVKKDDRERENWWDDTKGHGTQVSGIIGAQNGWGRMNGIISAVNNNYAIQMYKVTLDPSKVALPAGQPLPPREITAPVFSVLDAIRVGVSEAEKRGATVVNISIGWDRHSVKSEEEIREIYNLFKETMQQYPKILFVTSAGNGDKPEDLHASQGLNVKQIMHAPGGVNTDNNITVAASDAAGLSLAPFSNYGPGVDIAAPGIEVFTTDSNGSYTSASGTSFSAAMVSGAAALLLSIEPSLSPQEVREIFQSTVSRSISSPQGAIGLLNMAEAVKLTLMKKTERDRQRLGMAALAGIATAAIVWMILSG